MFVNFCRLSPKNTYKLDSVTRPEAIYIAVIGDSCQGRWGLSLSD